MGEWKTSRECHGLRFVTALLPMARPLQMSLGFKRLWTLTLLGTWLSIFAGNAAAYCTFDRKMEDGLASPPGWGSPPRQTG